MNNWYKKAQVDGVVYRGTNTPETKPMLRDFPGVYFTNNPSEAAQWGENIAAYKLINQKFYKPDTNNFSQKDYSVLKNFIKERGYFPSSTNKLWKKWKATQEPITEITEDTYWDVLGQIMLFPTKEWTDYLKGWGFNGFINGNDYFLFNPNDAQYIGKYDRVQEKII